jgi:hypothetical protein
MESKPAVPLANVIGNLLDSGNSKPKKKAAKKLKIAEISVEKVKPSGSYRLSHFQDGVLNSTNYMGYTKKEAMKLHRDNYGK